MPGLAASSKIFEHVKLPEEQFEMHLLEWISPLKKESIKAYAKRMSELIAQDNAILVGVSFGGIIVQEMKEFVRPKKIIIISSAKSNLEFPRRMIVAKKTKAYKLIPTRLFMNIELFAKHIFDYFDIKQRIELYKKYLTVRDKDYLDWAIDRIINWERKEIDTDVIHIQGEFDEVFPMKNIKNCIVVKGGRHVMILNRFRWFNENLPKIMID